MTKAEVKSTIGDPTSILPAMAPEVEAWEYRFIVKSGTSIGQVVGVVLSAILIATVVVIVVAACAGGGGGGGGLNLGGFGGGGGGGEKCDKDSVGYRFKVYFGRDGRVTRVGAVKATTEP